MTPAVKRLLLGSSPFTPLSIPGCVLWLDPTYGTTYGTYTNSAGSFASASSQSISYASDAGLGAGTGVPFWWSVWINPVSAASGTIQHIVGKSSEYDIRIADGGSLLAFTNTLVGGNPTSPVSAGVWQHYLCYSDGSSTWGIIKNGGTATTASYSNSAITTNVIRIGSRADSGTYFNGQIESTMMGKSPSMAFADIAALLYAGGNGRKASSLTTAERTAIGITFGGLDNAQSSLTNDVIGGRTGTNNNAVTVGSGVISAPAAVGETIALWVDRAAGVQFVQSTYAARPTLQVDGKLVVRLDGVDDGMTSSAGLSGAYSIVLSQKANATTVGLRTVQDSVLNSLMAPNRIGLAARVNSNAVSITNITDTVNIHTFTLTAPSVGSCEYYIDGVNSTDSNAAAADWTAVCLGAAGGFAEPANADVRALVAYSRVLSMGEIARLTQWGNR